MARPRIPDAQRMLYLGIRLTPVQMERLVALSALDGLPKQEHIRRAVDAYLLTLTPDSPTNPESSE
jgi:predicted DNA-binding protein